jgi:hypothetical protein
VHAPALQSVDWTVINADGEPRLSFRGVRGPVSRASSLVTGYEPLLLPRTDPDGSQRLLPYNLVTTFYWRSQPEDRPVLLDELKKAFSGPPPALVSALDENGNGEIEDGELRLDTAAKVEAVKKRLVEVGVGSPAIGAEIQPYGIHHSVAPSGWATRDCEACHTADSRVNGSFRLADFAPGGARPVLVGDATVLLTGEIERTGDGPLVFRPQVARAGLYLLGHDRLAPIDILGLLATVMMLLGVALHAGLRIRAHSRRRGEEA